MLNKALTYPKCSHIDFARSLKSWCMIEAAQNLGGL